MHRCIAARTSVNAVSLARDNTPVNNQFFDGVYADAKHTLDTKHVIGRISENMNNAAPGYNEAMHELSAVFFHPRPADVQVVDEMLKKPAGTEGAIPAGARIFKRQWKEGMCLDPATLEQMKTYAWDSSGHRVSGDTYWRGVKKNVRMDFNAPSAIEASLLSFAETVREIDRKYAADKSKPSTYTRAMEEACALQVRLGRVPYLFDAKDPVRHPAAAARRASSSPSPP